MLERMSEYFTSYGSSNAYIYMYCRDIAWVMFWSKHIGTHFHIDYFEERIMVIIITMFILFSASVIFFA